jgi:EmrB/QacA subfamily drug resistance transporter
MSSSTRAPARPDEKERLGWRARLVLVIIVSCQLMLIVDTSIVNVALPSIQRGLHFSSTGLAWVPSLYALVFGGLLLAGGRAGDIWGRQRMLVTGVAIFTVASMLGGLATSAAWLLAARAVQGVGAALAGPSTLSLIAANFAEGQARNRALAAFSMVAGVGLTIGFLLGGVLTAELSWRWVMFVNVPAGAAVMVLTPRFVHEPERHPGRIDWVGTVASTLGMGALAYAFIRVGQTGWSDHQALASFAVAAVSTVGFVAWEARAAQPVMPLRLFARRNRAAGLANMFLLAGALSSTIYFMSQLLQEGLGMSPLRSGLAVLPLALTQIASAQVAPRLVARAGPKPVTVSGTVLITGAMAWLSRITVASGYVQGMLGPMLLFGIGIGLSFMPLNMMIIAGVPRSDSGAISGLLQAMQRIGGSVGVAVLVTAFGVAARHAAARPRPGMSPAWQDQDVLVHGIAAGFTLATVFCLCALLVAILVIRSPRPGEQGAEGPGCRPRTWNLPATWPGPYLVIPPGEQPGPRRGVSAGGLPRGRAGGPAALPRPWHTRSRSARLAGGRRGCGRAVVPGQAGRLPRGEGRRRTCAGSSPRPRARLGPRRAAPHSAPTPPPVPRPT